ncbi:MAG: GlcG protein [Rhodobacteraceae bacterium CG17_big_fil_post_rev_8_21_14_2_50_63_15]|nr:heme-binding protein [Roseovarius sp.]PIV77116.1 MAG: GlcG protein [Rhodobacteraceae bacterium CG17_big_fil_post_rev_8_21_14_2_50_63_15]
MVVDVLTLAQAQGIVAAALAGARSGPERFIAVCVVDAGGHPLAMLREERAPPLLSHIAEAKARTCVLYGRPTRLMRDWAEATPNWFHGVREVALARAGLPLIASLGGVIIRAPGGALMGACGIAGEAGEQDEALGVQGIRAAGLVAEAG